MGRRKSRRPRRFPRSRRAQGVGIEARLGSGDDRSHAGLPQARAGAARAKTVSTANRHCHRSDPPHGRWPGQSPRRAGGADDAPPSGGHRSHQGRPRARRSERECRLRRRSQGAVVLEGRVQQLEQMIKYAVIIETTSEGGSVVVLGVDGRRGDRPPRRGDLHDRGLGRGRRHGRQDQLHVTDRACSHRPQGRREDPRRDSGRLDGLPGDRGPLEA